MVLAKSLKETNPDAKMVICLLEREIPEVAKEFKYFDKVVLAKELGFDNFDSYIFRHSIVEAATSVKGQLFVYLLKEFSNEDKFIYLDPDIKVLSPMTELIELLDNNDIVLTPHLCEAEGHIDAVMDNELCALQHGVFNLGFLAIRRSQEAQSFINWWTSRLAMFCYDDIPRGIFTDQKWIDLAPCFFNVYILKHPGYNIAPWNLSRRKVTKTQEEEYLVNDKPIRFFHFSGFDSGANEGMINKYVPDRSNSIYPLRNQYVIELDKAGQKTIGETPWSYDYYFNGEKIDREARLIYRDNLELIYKYPSPFNENNQTFLSNNTKVTVEINRFRKLFHMVLKKLR
jgi:hypothetical protein